jgi:MSHA biogenesis protein MshN
MSVVNKMLQDLETRQTASDTVNADYQPPKRSVAKFAWISLVILTVILVALAGYYWPVLDSSTSNQATSKPSVNSLLQAELFTASQANDPEADDSANKGMAINEPVVATPDAPTTDTKKAIFEPQDTQPTKVNVAVSRIAEMNSAEPQIAALTGVKQAEDTRAQSKAVFSKQANQAHYAEAGLKQTINQALREGNTLTAIKGLQTLLTNEPENVRVRKKLTSLLFAENRIQEAKALLMEGLLLQPQQHDLRLMLARLFTQQEQLQKALALLLEVSPSITVHSEYYAYRAALAQRSSNYNQAQQDYQNLVDSEPNSAKWWLGLGIAQDSLGENAQAQISYSKADNDQQLSPEVMTFLRGRLQDLAGIE